MVLDLGGLLCFWELPTNDHDAKESKAHLMQPDSLRPIPPEKSELKKIVEHQIFPVWYSTENITSIQMIETLYFPGKECIAIMTLVIPSEGHRRTERVLLAFPATGDVSIKSLTDRFVRADLSELLTPPDAAFVAAKLPAGHSLLSVGPNAGEWTKELVLAGLLAAEVSLITPEHKVVLQTRNRTRGGAFGALAVSDSFRQSLVPRARLEQIFREEMAPNLWPGSEVLELRDFESIYAPGEDGVCQFTAVMQTGEAARFAKTIVITFSSQNGIASADNPDSPVTGGDDYTAEVFPDDSRIPGLRAALDPDEVTNLLQSGGALQSEDGHEVIESSVLRYRPHERCVISYRVRANNNEARYICKAFSNGNTAEQVYTTLTKIRALLPDPSLAVRPIACDKDLALVMMEFVEGVSLGASMDAATQQDEIVTLTELAARTLAVLHGVEFEHTRVKTFETEERKLRDHAAAIKPYMSEFARVMDSTLDLICAAAESFKPVTPTFLHGGYKPTHVIVPDGKQFGTVLDFDGSCLGDPALDVGRFMAKLRADALEPENTLLGQMDAHFLRSYVHESVRDVEERAHVYQSLALVRMASRRFETNAGNLSRGRSTGPLLALLEEAGKIVRP